MGRWVRWAGALAVVVGAGALVVVLGRAAGPRAGGHTFLFGVLFLTLGAIAIATRLARLRPAEHGRWSVRAEWGVLVIGAAFLGLDWVDGWVAAETTRANIRAALGRGQTAVKAGDWAGAADAYSEAIRLDPDNADARRRRGAAYLHLGELDRALADLDAAARLAPDDVGVVYNRGLARFHLGDAARGAGRLLGSHPAGPDPGSGVSGPWHRTRAAGKRGSGRGGLAAGGRVGPGPEKGGGLDL